MIFFNFIFFSSFDNFTSFDYLFYFFIVAPGNG